MKNNGHTEIVVFCGGKGTRLTRKLPMYIPKCLAPIDSRPFLDILLEQIESEFPSRKITLATGHLHEAVEAFAKNRVWGNPLELIFDEAQNGTAQIAYDLTMRVASANTMFINGDTWQEDSLQAVIDHHKDKWYTPMTVSVRKQADCGVPIPHLGARGIFVLTQQFIARHKDVFQGKNLDEMFCIDVQKNIGSVKFCWQEKPYYDIGTPESLNAFRVFWKARTEKLSSQKPHIVSVGSEAGRTIRSIF